MTRTAMNHADAAWLHMDRPTNLMVINSVMWFDAPLEMDALKRVLQERLVDPYPPFRRRVADGSLRPGAAWEDVPDFDIDVHMHHMALPAPGDRRALEDLVSDLATRPLDHDRPLWDVYLIDGYGAGCAVLTRMHHCIADGIALARVMMSLTDGPRGTRTATRAFTDHQDGRGAVGTALWAAGSVAGTGLDVLAHPSHAVDLAATAGRDTMTVAKLLLSRPDPRTPLKGAQHSAHRVGWSDPIPLWRVKAAGKPFGATVNDVLVAAVAGGIRTWMREQGEEPREIHAMVPFNLRPLDRPLPRDLGNKFGLVILPLPVGVEDPVDRLMAAKKGMDEIKHSVAGIAAYGILDLIGRTPAAVESRIVDYFSSTSSMVLTNVPGPRQAVSLAGVPVRGVLVWAPSSGSIGMSVSLFSYRGAVTVGFLTDRGLVPDPAGLASGVRDEVLALGRLARRAAAPAAGD